MTLWRTSSVGLQRKRNLLLVVKIITPGIDRVRLFKPFDRSK